jgi:predicted transcriptional regulator
MTEARDPGRNVGPEDVLGPLGAAAMRVVWDQGATTVGAVLETLNARGSRPLAYTTVMTVLGRLHEKGLLERSKNGRQFVYRAAADEAHTVEALSQQAVDRLVDRYGTSALRQFAIRLGDVDPTLRAQLLDLASRRSR